MSISSRLVRCMGDGNRLPRSVRLSSLAHASAASGRGPLYAVIFERYSVARTIIAGPALLFMRVVRRGGVTWPPAMNRIQSMQSWLNLYLTINVHVPGVEHQKQDPSKGVNRVTLIYPVKTTTIFLALPIGKTPDQAGAAGTVGSGPHKGLRRKTPDGSSGYEPLRNYYEAEAREEGPPSVPTRYGEPGPYRTDLIAHGGDGDFTPPLPERAFHSPKRVYFAPALITSHGMAHLKTPRSGEKDSSHDPSITFPPLSGLRFLSMRNLRFQFPSPSSPIESPVSKAPLRHGMGVTDQQYGQWPEPTVVRAPSPPPKGLHGGTFSDMHYGPETEQRHAAHRKQRIGSQSRAQHVSTGSDKSDQPLTLRRSPPPAGENRQEIGRIYGPENPHGQRPYSPAHDVRHHIPAGEIRLIADKVYNLLEKRIAIEKERRGLL